MRSLSHAGRLAERAPLSSQCPFSSFKVAFQARGGGHRFWASGPRSGWVWVPPWPLSSCMMWASHSSFLISSFLSGRATCLTPVPSAADRACLLRSTAEAAGVSMLFLSGPERFLLPAADCSQSCCRPSPEGKPSSAPLHPSPCPGVQHKFPGISCP